MTLYDKDKYVASLEGYIEKLEAEIQMYQILMAFQMNEPSHYEQTKPVDEGEYQGA